MSIVSALAGLVIGSVVTWQVIRGHADAELRRVRAALQERAGYWQEEAERCRGQAARLREQTAAWVAGCQRGREDVLSLAQALAPRPAGTDDDAPRAG